jgi:dTDP-4-amino-4,6-dideoxygalactose transaminase
MRNIPFSPPRIDQLTIDAVTEVLQSGWITTGPKTRELEKQISLYCNVSNTLCLNSWTNAAELVLRWWGVGPGDEVIIPAYTYAATANIIVHTGAKPVLADIERDGFNMDLSGIEALINERTKVIMPVDMGGLSCDYDAILALVKSDQVTSKFSPANDRQKLLQRILVLADAAHSFGALYKGARVGSQADVMGFSFHAVKNLTTAEGGAITLNLPKPFDNAEIWRELNVKALHGQTKDALSKTLAGQWRYDIVEAGYKCNMTDIQAAIGLTELKRYNVETLQRRKTICQRYNQHFKSNSWFVEPHFQDDIRESCYHLYMLRINGFSEENRDALITSLAQKGIALNVHFQPLPLLTFYKALGYRMADYPNAYNNYKGEVSLPVYFDLTDEDVDYISEELISEVERILTL